MRRRETLIRHILFMLKGLLRNIMSEKSCSKVERLCLYHFKHQNRAKRKLSKKERMTEMTKPTKISVIKNTGIFKFHVIFILARRAVLQMW